MTYAYQFLLIISAVFGYFSCWNFGVLIYSIGKGTFIMFVVSDISIHLLNSKKNYWPSHDFDSPFIAFTSANLLSFTMEGA
jgi:hypothetical protein